MEKLSYQISVPKLTVQNKENIDYWGNIYDIVKEVICFITSSYDVHHEEHFNKVYYGGTFDLNEIISDCLKNYDSDKQDSLINISKKYIFDKYNNNISDELDDDHAKLFGYRSTPEKRKPYNQNRIARSLNQNFEHNKNNLSYKLCDTIPQSKNEIDYLLTELTTKIEWVIKYILDKGQLIFIPNKNLLDSYLNT